ncbi:MAG: Mpo1-like protein [Labilithrix sp.]
MKTITEHLTTYATYHRDRRNIATHFFGIPTIFVASVSLLSRPVLGEVFGVTVSPATVVGSAVIAFYLALERRLGGLMGVLTIVAMWGGSRLATLGLGAWLATSLGLFVFGWIVQFIGHAFEGKKPAFADDLIGLLIGPLFVVSEVVFALGLRHDLRDAIEKVAGPTRSGRVVSPTSPRSWS